MTYLETAWRAGRSAAEANLRTRLAKDPEHSPYGAAAVGDNTFAAACYNDNTVADLDLTGCKKSDRSDRTTWRLSAYEWAYQIGVAYAALAWDRVEG
jgi:hypothetical protein